MSKADLNNVANVLNAAGFIRSTETAGRLETTKQKRIVILKGERNRAKLVRGNWTAALGPRVTFFWEGRRSRVVGELRNFETADLPAIREHIRSISCPGCEVCLFEGDGSCL